MMCTARIIHFSNYVRQVLGANAEVAKGGAALVRFCKLLQAVAMVSFVVG
jgi:hypothetical protein